MVQRRNLLLAAAAAPVLSLQPTWVSAQASAAALLSVSGARVAGSRHDFSAEALERLPQQKIVTATPWYPQARSFTGPLMRDVLAAAGVKLEDATGVARCVALNDYKVDIPLEDPRRFGVIIARLLDDRPMSVREKGPLFVMYPFDAHPELRKTSYFARCIWQLRAIELT